MAKPKPTWKDIKSEPERLRNFKKNFVINGLRKLSYRWPGRYNCNNLNKLGYNEYFCNLCGVVAGRKNFNLDHIIPVVDKNGFSGFDDYIEKMFCTEDNFQRVCKVCHKEKSLKETNKRVINRKKSLTSINKDDKKKR